MCLACDASSPHMPLLPLLSRLRSTSRKCSLCNMQLKLTSGSSAPRLPLTSCCCRCQPLPPPYRLLPHPPPLLQRAAAAPPPCTPPPLKAQNTYSTSPGATLGTDARACLPTAGSTVSTTGTVSTVCGHKGVASWQVMPAGGDCWRQQVLAWCFLSWRVLLIQMVHLRLGAQPPPLDVAPEPAGVPSAAHRGKRR